MLEISGLTKEFGSYKAVENLNLTVKPGELFGFLGPNGAGKTTTIKMLTGLLKPTAGTAKIAGYDIRLQPLQAKALLGYVPDTPLLYEKLTGREFLRFIMKLYEMHKGQPEKAIDNLLDLFELRDRGDDLIQSYSHGMKQKTALAGVLLHDPKVILLDEPTVGLDPKSARLIKDILRELTSRGATVFMSTHILEIAEKMCDRVGIINKGKLMALGTPSELRQAGNNTLEDTFLELTGGTDSAELSRFLGEEPKNE